MECLPVGLLKSLGLVDCRPCRCHRNFFTSPAAAPCRGRSVASFLYHSALCHSARRSADGCAMPSLRCLTCHMDKAMPSLTRGLGTSKGLRVSQTLFCTYVSTPGFWPRPTSACRRACCCTFSGPFRPTQSEFQGSLKELAAPSLLSSPGRLLEQGRQSYPELGARGKEERKKANKQQQQATESKQTAEGRAPDLVLRRRS